MRRPSFVPFIQFIPLVLGCATAAAQAGVPVAASSGDGVAIVRTTVRAAIEDGAATTTIEQAFANRGARLAEATWLLPLPEGAIADGLKMIVDGKEICAEVLDQATARGVYEAIVRQRRDPALLEYMGAGLLRARVFPIAPQREVVVQVRLRQSLPLHGGLGEWSVPLRALRSGERNEGPIGVDVTVRAASALKTVVASRGDAEVRWHGENEARVAFEIAPQAPVERELSVLFGLAEREFGMHALTYRRPGEAGWFVLYVSPRRALPPEAVPERCVQFVIDTSGSMQGKKLEQAKAALRAFLATLRPVDRFQIVPFATEAQPFFAAARRAEPAALAEAQQRIDRLEARGGTNIGDALAAALGAVPARDDGGAGLLSQIVFVTDGQPTVGTTNPQQLLADARARNTRDTRVFVFGVGDDLNRDLLADLAAQNRGSHDFVGNDEAIDRKTAALCARLAQPALTDVAVQCDLPGFTVTPRAVPDLFCGDTLQLCGRYEGSGRSDVVLRGVLCGETKEFRFAVEFPAADTRHDFVPVSWAQRQIETLLGEIRRGGQRPELVTEVGRLAREFGITTPYTSQLIVEEGLRMAGMPKGPCAPSRGGVGPTGPYTPGGPTTPGPGGAAGPGAAGPTTGGGATSGSDEFYLGGTRTAGRASAPATVVTRRAAGRTFLCVNGRWLESGLPTNWEQQQERIAAFGDDYFALLAAHPDLREAFALGTDVVLRVGARIVRIAAEPAAASANERQR